MNKLALKFSGLVVLLAQCSFLKAVQSILRQEIAKVAFDIERHNNLHFAPDETLYSETPFPAVLLDIQLLYCFGQVSNNSR